MLEVNHLSVRYGHHQALDDVSLTTGTGEIVVILGANGAGKSTLLKAIGGMVPASGQVSINNRPVSGLPAHQIVESGLALVPEGRGIFGELSVQENLTLGAYAQRARETEASNLDRVFSLFPRLTERRNQMARTMSGGEQQMVAIGRAMMSAPDVLMLDEPSLGLSPLLCRDLFKSLQSIRDAGTSVLLVEQNARQSLAIADRAYLLENGHIVGEGPASELARDPAVQTSYLGGAASAVSKQASLPRESPAPASVEPIVTQALDVAQSAPLIASNPTSPSVDTSSIQDLVAQAEKTQSEHIEKGRNDSFDVDSADPIRTGGSNLEHIVAQIESAAQSALQNKSGGKPRVHIIRPKSAGGSGANGSHQSSRATNPTANGSANEADPADRPTIPVWRRDSIRVYRRNRPDGPLERVDDTN